ncbi:excisionase family DNA-binding protein [Amycolatopsis sp. NPDC049868]|uniref:excisionase family DNA-binding protein n=1 Tax=Amycolatopsis sp. NPDC049868 TaxID=3363934 RepID=UPI0037AD7BC0
MSAFAPCPIACMEHPGQTHVFTMNGEEDVLPRRAWTPREAAHQLGIPYETVLRLIHDEKLHAVTAGRYYLIPDSALESFLNPRARK